MCSYAHPDALVRMKPCPCVRPLCSAPKLAWQAMVMARLDCSQSIAAGPQGTHQMCRWIRRQNYPSPPPKGNPQRKQRVSGQAGPSMTSDNIRSSPRLTATANPTIPGKQESKECSTYPA